MKRAKRLLTLLVVMVFMMLPMTALAATKVTPDGNGNAYRPFELKDLDYGEYEFSCKSGETVYVSVTTKVAAEVYIKQDPKQVKKNVGPNNSYLANINYQSSSTTCTVIVQKHKHVWKANSGTCSICGAKCKHSSATIVKCVNNGVTDSSPNNHTIYKKCKTCGYEFTETGKHGYAIAGKGDGNHYIKCTKCNAQKKVACKLKTVTSCKPKTDFAKMGTYHRTIAKCDCGYKKAFDEVHTFKGNKCTGCGFTRVVPGEVTGLKVTRNTALKKSSHKFEGYWSDGTWVKAHTVTYYEGTVTFSFDKPKNGYKYEISYTPYVEGIVEGGKTTQIVDATSNKIRVVLPNATNEVTFKVVPISKTGTRGKAKTIKKTVY